MAEYKEKESDPFQTATATVIGTPDPVSLISQGTGLAGAASIARVNKTLTITTQPYKLIEDNLKLWVVAETAAILSYLRQFRQRNFSIQEAPSPH